MNILSRVMAKKTDPLTTTDPTPHELAGKVRKVAGHQVLESRLSSIRAQATELRAKLIALRIASNPNDDHSGRAIRALGQEIEANDQENRRCRLELAPMRTEHAERVAVALAPMRKAAAERVATAAAELDAALAAINEIHDAGRLHGADMPSLRLEGLGDVIRQVRNIA